MASVSVKYTRELSDRDRRVVQAVARHQQLSSHQIHRLAFPDTSRTPVDRSLVRLVKAQYLIRVLPPTRERHVGGPRGGSGPYYYSLGRRGFYMLYEGNYTPVRAIRPHALAVADCAVILSDLARAGVIELLGSSIEDEAWLTIGRDELHPDMYVEAKTARRHWQLLVEVDLGSEGQRQIRAKLARYVRAFESDDWPEHWESFPGVLWVAMDAERVKELRWIIGQMRESEQALFRVVQISEFAGVFQ